MLDVQEILYGAYAAMSMLSYIVGGLYLSHAHQYWKEGIDDRSKRYFELAFGIGLAWLGDAMFKTWWIVFRFLKASGGDSSWMIDHPALLFFMLPMMVGLLLHMRTVTRKHWGCKWIGLTAGAMILAFGAGVGMYTYLCTVK